MLQQIKQLYAFIKKWFWALPMWKRTILTSIIGAFAGSSVIGFLNRYALYYHALKQGFRMPVEGVEYLDLAVSLLSFFIVLISTIGTIVLYNLISVIVNKLHSLVAYTNNTNRITNRIKRFILDKEIFSIIIMILNLLFFFVIVYLGNILNQESIISNTTFSLIVLVAISITLSIGLSTRFYDHLIVEKKRKTITLIVILLGVVSVSSSLFNQKIYSSFLATIHYGGRIPVVIEYREADNTATSATGELLIRTSHSVTILNTHTCAHEEIPAERVSKIGFVKE